MNTASAAPDPSRTSPPRRSRVSLAAWTWTTGGAPAAAHGGERRAAVVQAAVMFAVALLLRFGLQRPVFALVVAGLAAIVLVLGLLWPAGYRPVRRFGDTLGRAVGTLLTYLLLVPFFFVLVVPAAVLLRLQRRDPLHRTWREAGITYWIVRRSKPRDENITRQFLREDRAARAALRPVGAPLERGGEDGRP